MYRIVGSYAGRTPEQIDTSRSEGEIVYLLREYQLAFDKDWRLWIEKFAGGTWTKRREATNEAHVRS